MPPLTIDRRKFLASTAGAALSLATAPLAPAAASVPSKAPAGAPASPETLFRYASIRGFNYTPSTALNDITFWRDYDERLVEGELELARRLGLNSARVFLHYVVYEREKAAFLKRLRHFVRAAHERGISTMPVVWDACFSEVVPEYGTALNDWIPNPGVRRLGKDFRPAGDRYARDLIDTIGPEPGLFIWDIMNEPLMTSWIWSNPPDKAERTARTWEFVRHYAELFARHDPKHPRTVGNAFADWIPETAGVVDVVSFHDYRADRAQVRAHLVQGIEAARAAGKPVLLTETGCAARSNPYDMALELCRDLKMGWYVWELMIGKSLWSDIHGIVYPDGTVRDPSIAAAVQGFFRRRTGIRVPYAIDKEGAVRAALDKAKKWRSAPQAPYADGLAALESMANQMEAGEIVPMSEPPSIRDLELAADSAANRQEVARLLTAWARVLEPFVLKK